MSYFCLFMLFLFVYLLKSEHSNSGKSCPRLKESDAQFTKLLTSVPGNDLQDVKQLQGQLQSSVQR